jgi:hypothetical protein
MTIAEAQAEMRAVYRNGSVGQLVSGLLWLASAAWATWGSARVAILVLVVDGMFIFPLTTLVLRALGGPAAVSRGNPFTRLAMEVAFVVPLVLPVVAGATLHRFGWLYPAMMAVVGAHYLAFETLYGLWQFLVLGAVLIAAGLVIAHLSAHQFAVGAWLTGAILLAVAGWLAALRPRPAVAAA